MFEGKFENNTATKDSFEESAEKAIIPENNASDLGSKTNLRRNDQDKKPFLEPLKTNRFFLIRVLYHILRSIWIVAMIVGGFIAWIISLLFI